VVSVEPCITETRYDVKLLGSWAIISDMTPYAPVPERGLKRAMGRASAGMPIRLVSGETIFTNRSRAPLARSIPIAVNIATIKGIIRIAT
jgi:hypothetical protein